MLGLLCLGGVGVAVLLYDKETKIERAEPDAVVDSFLGAYLVARDDKAASLYTCNPQLDLSKMNSFRADIQSREMQYSIGINITWRDFDVQVSDEAAAVSVDLVRTVSDGSEETSDRWRFQLKNDDGWRVCGAEPGS
ncbi:MAG TPA: hypothetical protein VGB74_09380 [Actinoplanes sp.]